MPNYKTHDNAALLITPIISGVALYYFSIEHALILGAGFILCTRYMSPDLDLNNASNKRWGFLRFIWYPYKKCIKHRSLLSHSGPFSATLRLVYLLLWILLPLLLFVPFDSVLAFIRAQQQLFLALYLSAVLADTFHTFLDIVTGELR